MSANLVATMAHMAPGDPVQQLLQKVHNIYMGPEMAPHLHGASTWPLLSKLSRPGNPALLGSACTVGHRPTAPPR
jgi:hypothetical protein